MSSVTYQTESHLRVEHLTLQGSLLTGIQVLRCADRVVVRANKDDLLAILLDWRHLQRPTQAIVDSQGRLYPPGIAKIQVVVRDRDFVECRHQRPIQLQIIAGASVRLLRLGYDAQDRGGLTGKRGRVRGARGECGAKKTVIRGAAAIPTVGRLGRLLGLGPAAPTAPPQRRRGLAASRAPVATRS